MLATTDGQIGDARTVILREADQAQHALLVYTDARAGKVAQIAEHPQGTLVMWSPALGWQLRLRVQLQTVTDGLELSSRWAQLKLSPAANDYLSPQAPGAPLDQALASRGERAHFALLEAQRAVDRLARVARPGPSPRPFRQRRHTALAATVLSVVKQVACQIRDGAARPHTAAPASVKMALLSHATTTRR